MLKEESKEDGENAKENKEKETRDYV